MQIAFGRTDGAAASPFVWTVEISVFEWGNFSELSSLLRLCWRANLIPVEYPADMSMANIFQTLE